jgi:hypothetical protein
MLRLAETDPANAAYFELFTGTGRAIRTGQMSVLGDGVQQLAGHPPHALRDLPTASSGVRMSVSDRPGFIIPRPLFSHAGQDVHPASRA